LGGTKTVQAPHPDAHKPDGKTPVPDTKNNQPSNGPLQRLKDVIPFRGRAKGNG
jgi:hypothetical protein